MKRFVFLLLILFVLVLALLAAINRNKDLDSVEELLPKQKMTLTYNGGFENVGYRVKIQEVKNNKILTMTEDAATKVVHVYIATMDEYRLVYSKEEPSADKNYINEVNQDILLLKAPIKVGTEWEGHNGEHNSITGINIKVTTPSGNYNTVEVTTVSNKRKSKSYYAKGLGYVKSISSYEGFDIISELVSIEINE